MKLHSVLDNKYVPGDNLGGLKTQYSVVEQQQ